LYANVVSECFFENATCCNVGNEKKTFMRNFLELSSRKNRLFNFGPIEFD
jgi:hypothetical protein